MVGIIAERAWPSVAVAGRPRVETAPVAAARILRAADEGSVAAELELQTLPPAGGAAPACRIGGVGAEQEGVEAVLKGSAHVLPR